MSTVILDKYTYDDLKEEDKAFLIKDLNETPPQVNAHIESFRRWLKSMPHLSCPTDAKFLLRFLRVSKFDHERAQRRLDNFCTVRSSPRGSPAFFEYFKVGDSKLNAMLDSKFHIPLGRIDSGEMVILYKWSALNNHSFTFEELAKVVFMGLDMLLEEEKTQIYGIKFFADLEDANRKVMETFADPKVIKMCYTFVQDSYPLRLKGQMFYGAPAMFDVVFQILQFFMSTKTKARTQRIPNNISKILETIPGIERILPKEYSGQQGTLNEIAEKWNERFRNYYKNGHPLKSISVDESKRPKETLSYLVEHKDYTGETFGTKGTFTKFDAF